jgi:hypothetical protein
MDNLTNGLYIAMAGTIATAGLYSRLSHKADKLRKGGKLDRLPTVSFIYINAGQALHGLDAALAPTDILGLL